MTSSESMTTNADEAFVVANVMPRLNAIEPTPGDGAGAIQAMTEVLVAATGASCVEIDTTHGRPVTAAAGTPRDGDDVLEEPLGLGSLPVGTLRIHGAPLEIREWHGTESRTLATHVGSLIVAHVDHAAAAGAGIGRAHMLASVSHELRTPLTFISGIVAELINGRDLRWPERVKLLDMIAQQSADMERIVEDLLADGQAGADRLELNVVSLDLAAEAINVAETARIELSATPATDQILCMGDERRVRQILRNLLTNADRYGGPVITMSVFRDLRRAYLAVCDDGPPIPIEERRHLFEDFTRIESSHSHPASVGIGLSVSRRLASLMGGSLGYEHDGRQSRFILGLPLA